MAVIKVQKIPKKLITADDVICSFCYNFPQYTYADAKKLPYKRILLLLKAARKEHARKMHDMARIVAAPHAKDGKQVKKLLEEFSDILNK